MKKGFTSYAICWAILLTLFNLLCFVTPAEWYGFNKFGGSFWAGYAVITLAFLGQLACAYKAFRAENAKKFFYNLPLITVSYTGLILTLVLGGLCMAIPDVPNWLGAIVGRSFWHSLPSPLLRRAPRRISWRVWIKRSQRKRRFSAWPRRMPRSSSLRPKAQK